MYYLGIHFLLKIVVKYTQQKTYHLNDFKYKGQGH